MKGIVFDRNRIGPVTEAWDGQLAIAALETPGVEVSYQTTFDPASDGKAVWEPFSKDGKLSNSDDRWISSDEPLAAAIAVRFTLEPGEKRIVPMVISWDLPVVRIRRRPQVEQALHRFLRRHWHECLGHRPRRAEKRRQVERRHRLPGRRPMSTMRSKPLWYRGMLFNELYILADVGSFWGRPVGSRSQRLRPVFSFMECYDYPYFETLDVRFYGSMPLIKFWPEIEKRRHARFRRHRSARIRRKNGLGLEIHPHSAASPIAFAKLKALFRTILACPRKIPSCR